MIIFSFKGGAYRLLVKFLAIRFLGLSTYRKVNGFFVAALYVFLSTPNSDDILFASLDDGNSYRQ